jgi:hypothetical protein
VTTEGSRASIVEPGMRGPSARRGLSPSSFRLAVPPPIYLLPENQLAGSGVVEVAKPKQPETKIISSCPVLPISAAPDVASLRNLRNTGGLLTRGLNWIRARQSVRSNSRRLQVAATVSLGDKRFVALIQIDGLQFLVGGGATNVALLAQLNGKESFGDLLQETMTVQKKLIDDPTASQAKEQ